MNKKGISTIVATVLIVLITVAAVTILWAALSPLINNNLDSGTSCFEVQDAVQIDSDKTYTCLNTTTGDINVRVTRSANSNTLDGFEILVEDGGNTVQGSGLIVSDLSALPENGGQTFTFVDGADFTGPVSSGQVKVSIAPQVLIDGEASSCTGSSAIDLRDC